MLAWPMTSIFQLVVSSSMALRAVASHAIGYADH